VLGREIAAPVHSLAAALQQAVSEPGDRSQRARRVAVACAPELLTERLGLSAAEAA
jgi:hypothetical protein